MEVNPDSIVDRILELVSEDDYGFWELGWAAGIKSSKDPGLQAFGRKIADLVRSGVLISKRRNPVSEMLEVVPFNEDELTMQLLRLERPSPGSDYWFGLPDRA